MSKRWVLLIALLGSLWATSAAAQPEVEALLDELRGLVPGSAQADPAAAVAQELPAVEAATGLTATAPIPAVRFDRKQAAAHVAGLIEEQVGGERLGAMEAAWKALGLLPRDASLRAAIEQLYSSQAGGFYDPKAKRMVLLQDLPAVFVPSVLRHELVHALQDQTWSLTDWLGDAALDEDRAAARQAVLEGHAVTMANRVHRQQSGIEAALQGDGAADLAELLGLSEAEVRELAEVGEAAAIGAEGAAVLPPGTPPALAAQLLFPYSTGATFVAEYLRAHPEDPSARALFERPPETTAEVLAPERWAAGLRPTLPNPGTFLPGFSQTYDSSLGRLLCWVLLSGQADPSAGDPYGARWNVPDRDRRVALGSGWRGDRVVVFRSIASPPGTSAPDRQIVVWVSDWRDEDEARRVAAAASRRVPGGFWKRRSARLLWVFGATEAEREPAFAQLSGW
jgi:hypothetical protein